MKTMNFYNYLPQRYAAVCESVNNVRNLVYSFKDGDKNASVKVANKVVGYFYECYGIDCKNLVMVCCPSSSMGKYRRRFSYFSAVVSKHCRQENAMKHIEIIGRREAIHLTAEHVVRESAAYRVNLDADFFKGKYVIVFDDLITSGETSKRFADKLTEVGANVLGGVFLARTVKGILKGSKWGQFAEHVTKTMANYEK